MTFASELFAQLDLAARIKGRVKLTPRYSEPYHTDRGFQLRLGYILSERTGAPIATVARIAKVSPATVRGWANGARPSRDSRERIGFVYERFRSSNNRVKLEQARLREARSMNNVLTDTGTTTSRGNRRTRGWILRLENASGDMTKWAPDDHWPTFINRWTSADVAGCDRDWDQIAENWRDSDAQPWMHDLITSVKIV